MLKTLFGHIPWVYLGQPMNFSMYDDNEVSDFSWKLFFIINIIVLSVGTTIFLLRISVYHLSDSFSVGINCAFWLKNLYDYKWERNWEKQVGRRGCEEEKVVYWKIRWKEKYMRVIQLIREIFFETIQNGGKSNSAWTEVCPQISGGWEVQTMWNL